MAKITQFDRHFAQKSDSQRNMRQTFGMFQDDVQCVLKKTKNEGNWTSGG